MRKLILPAVLAALSAAAIASPAAAQDVKRIGAPNSAILQAAVVPAGSDIIYVSGITPPNLAPQGQPADFGDTKTQTIGIIKRIEEILKAEGAGLGDVFMMRVLLVGDPAKGGKMDFAGMMEGYTQFFGTAAQPGKPARITSQVTALVAPGMMAEIEVQAVKPKK